MTLPAPALHGSPAARRAWYQQVQRYCQRWRDVALVYGDSEEAAWWQQGAETAERLGQLAGEGRG